MDRDAITAGQAGTSTEDVAARRARAETWQTAVAAAAVLLALAALVLLPFAHDAAVRPARDRMRHVAEPARGELTRLHVALALEGSLVTDYVESRDSAMVRRYREAVREGEQATARLRPPLHPVRTRPGARWARHAEPRRAALDGSAAIRMRRVPGRLVARRVPQGTHAQTPNALPHEARTVSI